MALCIDSYATAEEYASFWCMDTLTAEEEAVIESFLLIAANDIHVALAASGACNCTAASWAEGYLAKLNIIDATIWHQCPCGRPKTISDEMRQTFLQWIDAQLALLREGKLDICQNATGADFPAIGWAEQGLTDFNTAQIIMNYAARNR